jgi:Ca2+-binding EF-hand superfamily protein
MSHTKNRGRSSFRHLLVGNRAASPFVSLFRLFGDSNGDGHVDLQDLLRFAETFGKQAGDLGYLWYLDYDGDGRVDSGDLLQLLRRLGR